MLLKDDLTKSVLKELNIEHLSDKEQEEIVAVMTENIMKRVTIAVLDRLPPEKHPQFEALIGSGNVDKLNELIKPHIPDIENIVAQSARTEVNSVLEQTQK